MHSDDKLEISVISTTEETALDRSILTEQPRRSRLRRCLFRLGRCLLPSGRQCNLALTKSLILALFYGAAFGVLSDGALPRSELFAILLLAIFSFVGGKIFGAARLPPLVGMLLIGFLFRNLSFIPYHRDISHRTASILRDVALVIILLSAGLGLDGKKLKRMKLVVLQLTLIPLFVEAGSMAVFSHYLLGLPWLWGIMLGFIVSAISVAVVLPILIKFRRENRGTDKGIPTLILAASSIDDIVAISAFTVVLSILFTEGNITLILIKAPLEPLVGCAVGAVFGVLFWHLPKKDTVRAFLVYYHTLLLCFGGLCMMFITDKVNMSGSSSLGCITLAFVAALRWRKDFDHFVGVESVLAIIWEIVEPIMFALIGSEISIENLHSNLGYSILVILLALLCRLLVTPFITFGANLNVKEKIFVSLAWLPKATVQAAIGSRALDYARLNDKGEEYIMYGQQILTVSVLSIVISAPLGAALTTLLGPLLLSKGDSSASETSANDDEEEEEESGAVTTEVKAATLNYGSCHQLQPSDLLPPKA